MVKERKEELASPTTNIILNQVILREMGQDRRAKNFLIREYPNIQFRAGTESRDPLKACYLELRGTFETHEEDKNKAIHRTCKNISQVIHNAIDRRKFREEFICTKEISDSFVYTGKSYTKLEYTFFLKREMEFDDVTDELNRLSMEIWRNALQNSDKMTFHKELITKRKYAKKQS